MTRVERAERAEATREKARDETKRGGDPQKALALALIYLADAVVMSGGDIGDGLSDIGRDIDGLGVLADAAK